MTRIAHLSDLHLLEEEVRDRRGNARLRVNYLSLRRPLDFEDRRLRALGALDAAKAVGFDHLVVTGDLTEDGHIEQFDVVREVFEESGISPDRVTLIPGNHDAYGDGWDGALAGPLHRFARTSRPGAVTQLPGARVLAVSSAVPQHVLRSSGHIDHDQMGGIVDAARSDDLLILAQHHPPFKILYQWVHGLLNCDAVLSLLEAFPQISVLHGHIHRRRDRALIKGDRPRVFSPSAVADSLEPLRFYDVIDGGLVPVLL